MGGGWKYPGPHGGIYAPFALLMFTFIFAFLLFYIRSLVRSWGIPENPAWNIFVVNWTF